MILGAPQSGVLGTSLVETHAEGGRRGDADACQEAERTQTSARGQPRGTSGHQRQEPPRPRPPFARCWATGPSFSSSGVLPQRHTTTALAGNDGPPLKNAAHWQPRTSMLALFSLKEVECQLQ